MKEKKKFSNFARRKTIIQCKYRKTINFGVNREKSGIREEIAEGFLRTLDNVNM